MTGGAPVGGDPTPTPTPVARSRRHRGIRWIAGTVILVLVAAAIFLATRPQASATKVDSPLVGQTAPHFSETELGGSRTISLSAYRGRYVFLNFFASWCTPCQQEVPALVDFNFLQSRKTQGAALLSVVYDDPDADALAFEREQGIKWPAIPDPGGQIASAYGVSSPPTTILIDPRGNVVGEYYSEVTVADLDQMLAQARASAGSSA